MSNEDKKKFDHYRNEIRQLNVPIPHNNAYIHDI